MIKKSVTAPAPVSFEKTKYLLTILIALILVLLFSFGFRQGFAIFGPDISVVREISYIGEVDGIESFLVLLHIESNKYLIGIKEFLPDNAKVVDYGSSSYDVFEFKESENAWLIGDSSKKINIDLTYILEADSTDELNGEVLYSLNENIESAEIGGDSSLCFFPICMEKEIIAGDFYPIVFNAGEGFLSTALITRADGMQESSTIEICNSSECFGQQRVYVFFPDDFINEGYKLQVYDSANGNWIEFLFSVTGGRDLNKEISECSELNEGGITYVLMNNITIDEDCFTITADDVVLDGNGYILSHYGESGGYGVYAEGRKNIIIKNLSINGFSYGIYFSVNNSQFQDLIITNNDYAGIYLYSKSDNNILKNIISNSNKDDYFEYGIGIDIWGSNNSLTNIITNSNNNAGVHLEGSNNTVTNLTANNNWHGIYLREAFNCNVKNTITNNNSFGISIERGNNNSFEQAISNYNIDNGVLIQTSSNNVFRNISLNYNGQEGIWVMASGNNNSFENVNASSNAFGILISASSNNNFNNITANLNMGDDYEAGYGIKIAGGEKNILNNVRVCSNPDKDFYCSSSSGTSGKVNKLKIRISASAGTSVPSCEVNCQNRQVGYSKTEISNLMLNGIPIAGEYVEASLSDNPTANSFTNEKFIEVEVPSDSPWTLTGDEHVQADDGQTGSYVPKKDRIGMIVYGVYEGVADETVLFEATHYGHDQGNWNVGLWRYYGNGVQVPYRVTCPGGASAYPGGPVNNNPLPSRVFWQNGDDTHAFTISYNPETRYLSINVGGTEIEEGNDFPRIDSQTVCSGQTVLYEGGEAGTGNKFTKVTACTNGWPVLGVNYENC
ncbi:MAG: right-handed parallel beta-helix repeat-containing protein [Nanoarchaeota archaeon]|nr:right-handed parallel beta-helix repeat-containing protein [Nanoarchaeota archaeon]